MLGEFRDREPRLGEEGGREGSGGRKGRAGTEEMKGEEKRADRTASDEVRKLELLTYICFLSHALSSAQAMNSQVASNLW